MIILWEHLGKKAMKNKSRHNGYLKEPASRHKYQCHAATRDPIFYSVLKLAIEVKTVYTRKFEPLFKS